MAETSTIEWTDATWDPITGCSVVSPGCTNCDAMRLAGTRLRQHPSRIGLTRDSKTGPVWNGEVRLNVDWLDQPLRWRCPRRIFVCAHGDLFHQDVPTSWIDRVFAVMALAPWHTFQVLAKRAARMRAYISIARAHPVGMAAFDQTIRSMATDPGLDVGKGVMLQSDICHLKVWPLPNVWRGVSAEDQRRADERVPELLATPAALRFLSTEPLLGSLDIGAVVRRCLFDGVIHSDGKTHPLGWGIAGGESGPGARPMHPDWARSLRDQCAAADVPFLSKQWGAWKPICAMTEAESDALYRSNRVARDGEDQATVDEIHGRTCHVPDIALGFGGATSFDAYRSVDGHGGMRMFRVGKAAAGRFLDGVEHDGMPEARRG